MGSLDFLRKLKAVNWPSPRAATRSPTDSNSIGKLGARTEAVRLLLDFLGAGLLKRFSCAAIWAIVVTFAAYPSQTRAQMPFVLGPSTDLTPVEIIMRDGGQSVIFRVPRAYLELSEDGGPQTSFELSFDYTTMRPRRESGKDVFDDDVISVTLISHDVLYKTEDSIILFTKNDWLPVGQFNAEFNVYIGLWNKRKWQDRSEDIVVYLIPRDRHKIPGIYFDCFSDRLEDNPQVGCRLFHDYGKQFELNLIFRRRRFTEWPKFLAAAEKLLGAFQVKPDEQSPR
jgi:hypothetical protein